MDAFNIHIFLYLFCEFNIFLLLFCKQNKWNRFVNYIKSFGNFVAILLLFIYDHGRQELKSYLNLQKTLISLYTNTRVGKFFCSNLFNVTDNSALLMDDAEYGHLF